MAKKQIIIYTDGACLGNPGAGGYAAVLMCGNYRKEISEGFRHTTNNRMEIMAVINALKALKNPTEYDITIYTDSNLVVSAIQKNWITSWKRNNWRKSNKEQVLNPELWSELDTMVQKCAPKFVHVSAHTGIIDNERCDQLAKAAAMNHEDRIDENYERSNNSFMRQ